MKRKFKWIASLALASAIAAGTATTLGAFAASQEGGTQAVSPADLWTQTTGFTVEANVEVPDYMKYGKFVNYTNSNLVYTVDENSEEDYLEDWETNGVKITSTVANKKLYFSNVLDVNTLDKEDYFLAFAPIATIQGTADFTEMEFTLEDAEDPDNYVTIRFQQNPWWARGTLISVSTGNFSGVGYTWGEKLSDIGASQVCYMSFQGYTQDGYSPDNKTYQEWRMRALKMYYDAEEKAMKFTYQGGATYNLVDLDDPHAVGYGNEWEGFTSGRVRLSVAMKSFSGTSASAMIFNVFGQEMNGTTVADETAPVLKFDKAAEETPIAEVGKAYSVYGYTGDDLVSGSIACDITVTDPDGVETAVTGDTFTPAKTGYYALTYKAQDGAGNETERTFKILAQSGIEPIGVTVAESENVYSVGDKVALPEAVYDGGAGALQGSVSVSRVGGSETVVVKDNSFVPMLAGTYLATYKATDYVGNEGTKTIAFEIQGREKAAVASIQELKKLFDGVAVEVPMPTAYDYTSVPGSKLNATCEVVAKNADGTVSETIENGVFTPSKEKFGDSVTFEYTIGCNGNAGTTEKYSYTVSLNDLPEKVEGYFVFDGNEFGTEYNGAGESGFIRFLTKEGVTGDKSLSFAHPVGAEGFELAFAIPATATNFETVTLQLRDSMNAEIGFDLEIRAMTKGPDATNKLYVRTGGVDYAMQGTFNTLSGGKETASTTPLLLKYTDGEIVDYTKKTVCKPTVNFNGETFEGFPSGKVYLTVEFGGVTGTAGITLTKIATQTLGDIYTRTADSYVLSKFKDEIKPQIRLDSDIPDEFVLGQTVTIPYARAFDVLSPHVDVYVTLRTPAGKYIYTNTLVEEGMSFKIETYGTYMLRFTAKDSAGRSQQEAYSISANDYLAPTVTVFSGETLEAKAGKEISIPQAIVQDDRDIAPRLYIMIVNPDLSLVMIGERTADNTIDSYTFATAGVYYLRYYAVDSNYNATIKDVKVIVK